MEYRNPILSGMYPDPSVCRVGEDYYLVTSSFEYLPGIPVFHSRDLVHWQQIGHVIDRPEQMSFAGADASGGIYAPTIRYHDGRFYVVSTTVVGQGKESRNFYMWAKRPEGPWSMPTFVAQGGLDPSLFFDADGKVYLTSNRFGEGSPIIVIQQSEIDLETGKLLDGPHTIAYGSGGAHTEAPHLFFRDRYYYLVCAEGGTALGHMVTLFRARSPWGPFEEACPHNPILTARDGMGPPLCATGHADFITTQHGESWIVFLCHRNATPKFHHLGRETALLPVSWDEAGWPHIFGGKLALEQVDYPDTRLKPTPCPPEPSVDTFTAPELGLYWNFVRVFGVEYAIDSARGELRLSGGAQSLSGQTPALIARRQRHFDCEIRASLRFAPQGGNEEAGIALRMSDDAHYAWVLTQRQGANALVLKRRVFDMQTESPAVAVASDSVELVIRGARDRYRFGTVTPEGVVWHEEASTRLLSTEVNGGFVGVYVGMYATGNGQACQTDAVFTRFSYEGL